MNGSAMSPDLAGQSQWARPGLALSVLTLWLAPLMFGAAEPHWTLVLLVLVAVSLAAQDVRLDRVQLLALVLPAFGVAALWLVVMALQRWGGASEADRMMAAEAARLLGPPGAVANPSPISRLTSWPAVSAPGCAFGAYLCGLSLGGRRRLGDRMAAAFRWSALAFAMLGLFQALVHPWELLWTIKRAYLGWLTGPFVNRNTAATYFGAGFLCWLMEGCVSLDRRLAGAAASGRPPWRGLQHPGPSSGEALTLAGTLVLLAATIMTGSRAGVLLTLTLGLLLVAAVLFRRLGGSRVVRTPRGIVVAALVLPALLVAAAVNGVVADRGGALDDPGRADIYRATGRAIADRPWTGLGLGRFADAIPTYRAGTSPVAGVWEHAHSTPLEIAAEMGVPIAAVTLLWWASIGVVLLRGVFAARRPRPLVLAGLGVGLLAVLHSAVDFSLEIPGLAVPVAMLVGAAASRALLPPLPLPATERPELRTA